MSRKAACAALTLFCLTIACSATAAKKRRTTRPDPCLGHPIPGKWRVSRGFHDPDYEYRRIIEHTGIDIPADVGTKAIAPAAGKVIAAGADERDNNMGVVAVRSGLTYRVMHLSRIDVRKGQAVREGQVLGLTGGAVGAKGSGTMTTGPHLHLDVDRGGVFIDPLPLFCPDSGAPQE